MWISSVTIGTPDVRVSAEFYRQLLGWSISGTEEEWMQLAAPPDVRGLMRINLEYEREYQRPVWPSEPGRQHVTTHLDIPSNDLAADVARALGAGATLAPVQPQGDVRVLLDPFGHPFCLFQDD